MVVGMRRRNPPPPLADRLLHDALWQRIGPLLPVGELGCGSVTTCWNRFAEWASAGVFDRLQELLLDELGAAGCWTGSASAWTPPACAPFGGDLCGANP